MSDIDPHILKHLSVMQPELYWLDADPLEPEPHPTLVGDVTTDLCIVGAGYTGLWTALLAKERNPEREVIIVEQRETGFGASGRNGGFCNSSLTHGFINGYRRFKDDMQTLERMGRENFNEIEETIKKYSPVIVVETGGRPSPADGYLRLLGYKLHSQLRMDAIYVKE